MDRKGIDVSVISPGPQAFFYGLGDDQALKTARIVNEGIAQMVAARPTGCAAWRRCRCSIRTPPSPNSSAW